LAAAVGGRTWLPTAAAIAAAAAAGTCRRHSSPYVDQWRGGRRRAAARRPTVVVVPEMTSPQHRDDDNDPRQPAALARTISLRVDERDPTTPDVRDRRPSQLASKVCRHLITTYRTRK